MQPIPIIRKTCIALFIVIMMSALSSCATKQQLQLAMDEIDATWGRINQKILKENGERTYRVAEDRATHAAEAALQSLGFTLTSTLSSSVVSAVAITPKPFSDDEFVQIRKVEEPMMQAMAANHVGQFTSGFFYLNSGQNEVLVDVTLNSQTQDATNVKVDFRLRYIGKASLIYGDNPPPEAVRLGLKKWWGAFDSALAKT